MSHCSRNNRRKTYAEDGHEVCYHPEYDKYKKDDSCRYRYRYRYGRYHEFDKCDCFEEMRKLLIKLKDTTVVITTKKDGLLGPVTVKSIDCWLVTVRNNGGSYKMPISQISAIWQNDNDGDAIKKVCKRHDYYRQTEMKECCCGQDNIRQFLRCMIGMEVELIFEGEGEDTSFIVKCVTDQLVIGETNTGHTAIALCCITGFIDGLRPGEH